ncbi:transcriptional activator DEMETER [Dorcoceras hygrometricum]|uniref:Transcriptional activator DEMETER n=1 Tax=Dorcoceras hygrometricum TaxID=472368 RepID=A0A2Z7DD63_9LAMI|nr:transcriptional activator DEMETER [Dorcoceras hygrometricum]
MNSGRGMPTPLENKILRNGEIWVPPTPEKLVVHRSSHVTAEMEQNLMGAENWSDLLGIYTGLLQDETSHQLPRGFNPCSQVVLNLGELGQNVAPIETCNGLPRNSNAASFIDLNQEYDVQDLTFVETCTGIPKDLNLTSFVGQNRWELEHSLRDVAPSDDLRISNKYSGTVGYYMQNLGGAPPQKVDSLEELMGTNKHPRATPTNGPPNRPVVSCIGKPTIFNQHSLVRSNGKMHGSSSSIHLQNQILNEDIHFSGHNLQQISTSTFPVPCHADHNLNLPQRLKGASSSGTMPFQVEPVTPDLQKQMKNNQPMQVQKFFANDCSTLVKHKKDDAVCSQPSAIIERKHDEFGSNPGASTTVISAPPNEKIHSDGGNGEIDLNKTPQQRPPKRKKHRPKVIVEGEAKRTPKSAASRNRAADKNPSEKRKYVRKKGTGTSTTPSTDVIKDVEGSSVGSTVKSCRRVLNFNLENGVEKDTQPKVGNQTQNEERSKVPINLNLDSPNTEWVAELNKAAKSAQHVTANLYNCVQSVNHSPQFSPLPSTPSPPASKGHTLNVIARSLNARNANANQNGGQNGYNHLHQLTSGDLVQLVIEANSNEANLDRMRQPKLHSKTQLLEDLVPVKENQGHKRDHPHTGPRQPQTVTLMGSQLWSSNLSHASSGSGKTCPNASENMKRRKTDGTFHGTTSSMSSRITSVEDYRGQMDTKCKRLNAHSSKFCQDDGLPNSETKGQCTSGYQNDEFNKDSWDWYMKSQDSEGKFQQRHTSPHVHAKEKAQNTFNHLTQAQSTFYFATATNCNLELASERDPTPRGNEVVDSRALVSIERQIAGQTSDKLSLITHSRGRGRLPKTFKGSQEPLRNSSSVDYIIDRMKGLNINTSGKEIGQEERRAIVPYRGEGAIVSSGAFDLIKKRRPRPKVDLDPETNRLWNLLMGKEGSESADTMEDDKQQWWEKERLVLRNRADSFIARMHLVQGDRRFSKWKGSVVDSVIGVFLTQNVSDHLSSSAFMHLAAKFPIKSTAMRESCCQNRGSSLIERQKVRITYPDGTFYDHRMMREPVYNPSSLTSSESSECGVEIFTTRRTYTLIDQTKKIEEDMISSQSSSESVIFQASEEIRSSSGSNSEAEDQITGGNFSRNQAPSSFYEQAERIGAFKQFQLEVNGSSFPSTRAMPGHQQLENQMHGQFPRLTSSENACTHPFASNVPCLQRPVTIPTNSWPNMPKGLEKLEGNILPVSGKGSIYSLASTDANLTNGKGIENRHDMSGRNVERNLVTQQKGKQTLQPSTAGDGILNEDFEQLTYSSACSQSRKDQHVVSYRNDGTQETFQQEHTFLTGPTRPTEVSSKPPIDKQKHSKNMAPELSEMSQVLSSNGPPSCEIGTKVSHVSKQKAGKEKTDSFNWDALRKKVQPETGMRIRSADTMDSIDYEAIRNADVREISETIKERGMNNMLAERIKDFLNRLVQEHERIDLEWLRDVQPDKVKDYLLSIRGLGLKSVECVRLLTLHNVAFPVDTNVGRIAVRLGWVPLRPLPESLQLHLLELYPVLESIQKYLWPRLCHLEQETLYELHYQMITFGKVFCTKRDPNCNACPMRGDCRHFASAYASARLALPGTEGRQIVCSSAPTSANQMSDLTMKPMPLPPSEDNLEKGVDSMKNSEPIIEEPKTPEPPTEVTERDIEDAYYEDPDEIPVIKLNIEEFTSNLQSFMQEQTEMQGDMSKALVALSPEFASIPMPKLKNVSRLRTEHQVYELPDLHPLLKGLDKREPDDPSPYLLAIWTPGETSDSVQPPESNKCESGEAGSMCDKKTCFSCSSTREAQAQTVRGTILIPCRTAMRGSFPLNGTYFQVNEVFADHESSMNPIVVPRSLLWNLPRRTVFFGTSVTTIFKGLTTEGIQYCFWKGFVCVRGFDQKTRAPRPLSSRLHHPASKMVKSNKQ